MRTRAVLVLQLRNRGSEVLGISPGITQLHTGRARKPMQALLTSETAFIATCALPYCATQRTWPVSGCAVLSPRGRQKDMLLHGVADWELEICMLYSLAWTCSMTQLPSIYLPFIDSFYPLTGLIHSNIHLSTCLTFIHLHIHPATHKPIYPLTHVSTHAFISRPIHSLNHMPVHSSANLFINPMHASFYPPVHLSTQLLSHPRTCTFIYQLTRPTIHQFFRSFT